jgi:hypothetical protein
MPDRRGAAGVSLLLILGGLVLAAGVGYLIGNRHRPKPVEPPIVAQTDTLIVADSLQLARSDSVWADSLARLKQAFAARQAAAQDSIDHLQRIAASHFQASADGAHGAELLERAADSLLATGPAVRIRFGTDTALRVTLTAYGVLHQATDSLQTAYLGMRDSYLDQQKVSIHYAIKAAVAEGELTIEREIDSVRIDSLHQAVDTTRAQGRRQVTALRDELFKLRPPPAVSFGLGAEALAVLGSSPCFASVAGVRVAARTRGWLQVEGRATAGYGAGGCIGDTPRTGPALQVGGSIGL